MKVIILAAGKGSRLGGNFPKTLTPLPENETILERLLNSIKKFIKEDNITLVVGYKKNKIMEKHPTLNYIINEQYEKTNTAKSLLLALQNIEKDDIIWINGDLIIQEGVFEETYYYKKNCMAVSKKNTLSDEEIKYVLDSKGNISGVSKTAVGGEGEAFGLNKIFKKDIDVFKQGLSDCKNNDYFEKGVELAIKKGLKIKPLDIGDKFYTEVDFKQDLYYALKHLTKKQD